MSNPILVLAAHPDDEVLGCGGSIAKFSDNGAEVNVAFLADGISSRGVVQSKLNDELMNRRNAAKKACKILGANYFAIEGSSIAVNKLHKKFPNLKNNIYLGDASKDFFNISEIDLIVDRASVTRNPTNDIKKILRFF